MRIRSCQAKFLVCSILVIYILEYSFAGHHHNKDDDDDDDDDDPGCYPGRNCRPGCYCTGSYCRPYFPPHNQYLKRYACTGYNYPKGWKIWKKESKRGGGNTTLIVVAHHYEKSRPSFSPFLKDNNFTTHDTYEIPVPIVSGSTLKPPQNRVSSSTKTPITSVSDKNSTNTNISTVVDLIYYNSEMPPLYN